MTPSCGTSAPCLRRPAAWRPARSIRLSPPPTGRSAGASSNTNSAEPNARPMEKRCCGDFLPTSPGNLGAVSPSATWSRCACSISAGRFRRHRLRNPGRLPRRAFPYPGRITCGCCPSRIARRGRSTRQRPSGAAGPFVSSIAKSPPCSMSAPRSPIARPRCSARGPSLSPASRQALRRKSRIHSSWSFSD